VRAPSAQSGDVCRPHEMLEGLPLLDKARTKATRLRVSRNCEPPAPRLVIRGLHGASSPSFRQFIFYFRPTKKEAYRRMNDEWLSALLQVAGMLVAMLALAGIAWAQSGGA
jgi:hypothetical protein